MLLRKEALRPPSLSIARSLSHARARSLSPSCLSLSSLSSRSLALSNNILLLSHALKRLEEKSEEGGRERSVVDTLGDAASCLLCSLEFHSNPLSSSSTSSSCRSNTFGFANILFLSFFLFLLTSSLFSVLVVRKRQLLCATASVGRVSLSSTGSLWSSFSQRSSNTRLSSHLCS